MALSADQITAQNFKAFYDGIKPYLGYVHGGFTPIGTVITVMGTTVPAHYLKCDGTLYNIVDYIDLSNYILEQFGSKNYFGGDGTTTFGVPNLISGLSDALYCIACRNIYMDPANQYSTDEQVIGKWIDGKPLYQKTITMSSTVAGWNTLNHNISNIDNVIDGAAVIHSADTDGSHWVLPTYRDSNTNGAILINKTEAKAFLGNSADFIGKTLHLTIRYTKTTD